MEKAEWLICPICGRKTHDKIREDTEMKNFSLYCPKCKQGSIVDVKHFIVSVCKDNAKCGGLRMAKMTGMIFAEGDDNLIENIKALVQSASHTEDIELSSASVTFRIMKSISTGEKCFSEKPKFH